MATLKPFKALRYTEMAGDMKNLACPPYDIISDKQYEKLLENSEYNVIRLELPKEGEDVYATAAATLKKWEQDGILAQDETGGLYLYREEFEIFGQRKSICGIIGAVQLEEFSKGIILPHENTLSAAKEDRFNLMCATGCNFSLIYSLYFDGGKNTLQKCEEAIKDTKPFASFCDDDGVTHTFYKIENTDEICQDFADKKLFIADGHHRYETALRYRDTKKTDGSRYVMMMLVPMESDGLVVLPTHRVIKNSQNFNAQDLLDSCKEYFDIAKMPSKQAAQNALQTIYDEGKIGFVFYQKGEFYTLAVKDQNAQKALTKGVESPVDELDVTVLHTGILERFLGIDLEVLKGGKRVEYFKQADDAIKQADRCDCAFLLNPTRVKQIADVASAGGKMPQKSTYFYPKLITGPVMRKID